MYKKRGVWHTFTIGSKSFSHHVQFVTVFGQPGCAQCVGGAVYLEPLVLDGVNDAYRGRTMVTNAGDEVSLLHSFTGLDRGRHSLLVAVESVGGRAVKVNGDLRPASFG